MPPRLFTASTVAFTSSELPTFSTTHLLPDKNAAIMYLCAKDLDGGAVIVPLALNGVICTFIILHNFRQVGKPYI